MISALLPYMILVANNLDDIQHRSSADGLTTNNQTNLAIKGIIAIKAMSKMSSVVSQTADAEKYNVCRYLGCVAAKLTRL